MMRTLFRTVVMATVAVAFVSNAAGNETYNFDQSHSTIGFSVHHFLGAAVGRFKKFSGSIDVDRDHPANSSVAAKIDVRSIDSGIAKRDNHLCSPEFFNVAKFPEITFKSRGVKQTGPQSGDVTGDFTMHGVTRTITLHVKLLTPAAGEARQSHWQVTTEPLKRRDFGLTFGSTAETVSGIGQEVSINIDIEARRAR